MAKNATAYRPKPEPAGRQKLWTALSRVYQQSTNNYTNPLSNIAVTKQTSEKFKCNNVVTFEKTKHPGKHTASRDFLLLFFQQVIAFYNILYYFIIYQ